MLRECSAVMTTRSAAFEDPVGGTTRIPYCLLSSRSNELNSAIVDLARKCIWLAINQDTPADDPHLSMTDEEFNAIKKAAREEANNDAKFKIADNERPASTS